MAILSVHFDGDITVDHRVSIRVQGNTYLHLQRAIDRAYLINKYGIVEKNEKLTKQEYADTEFIAEYPREGGIILDAVRANAGAIVDRIFAATASVFEASAARAFEQHQDFGKQLAQRRQYAADMGRRAKSYEDVADEPPPNWAENYSNRSITKEIDQIVGQINRSDLENSSVSLDMMGTRPHLPLKFTPPIAAAFHRIAADRELGPPMRVIAKVRSLDSGNKKKNIRPIAKILNLNTGKEVSLKLTNEADFLELHPHHKPDLEVEIIVCPILEAGGFDMRGGDLMFLKVI